MHLKQRLTEAMAQMSIIDAHEHLPEEDQRLRQDVDVFTLFGHYTHQDLISAGMTREQYDWTQDPSVDLDERWEMFERFYRRTKHTSYTRAARLAAQRFYNADISRETYREISERMKAANESGIYERVFDACKIRVALTQNASVPDASHDRLVPVLPLSSVTGTGGRETIVARAREADIFVRGLDDYDRVMQWLIERQREAGNVGYKMSSARHASPSRSEAAREFGAMLHGWDYDRQIVHDWLIHRALDLIGEADLPVAVHCGMIWDNWNDFRTRHPKHMTPVALAHRNTRFDLYHAGIPWIRETGIMAKELPNCWLNMCWCHIISQRMSVSALDEWLDLVPHSKIIGFGGDYCKPVEKIYGHLVMAREDIAEALAGRIDRGTMSYGEAVETARMMLCDNPRDLYGLDL